MGGGYEVKGRAQRYRAKAKGKRKYNRALLNNSISINKDLDKEEITEVVDSLTSIK